MALRSKQWIAVLLALAVLSPVAGRIGILTADAALLLGGALTYAAAGLSLNLLAGYTGQISLAHFALLGVGAFTSGILTGADRLRLPFLVAVPAAALAGAAVAFVVGLPALRLRGLSLAVVTIALAFALEQSVFRAEFLSGGSAGANLPRPQINTYIFTRNADYLGVLFALLALVWLIDVNVTRTKIGRAFQAVRENEAVASSFAVDVARTKLLAFTLSGATAGIAGLMYGHLYQTVNSESFGFQKSLLLVIIVVIGGLGSRAGVLASAVFYFFLPEALINWFGEGFRGIDLIVGAALLMFTVSRHPGGLAGAFRERAEARAAKEREASAGTADGDDAPALPKLPQLPRPTGLPARPETAAGTPVLRASDVSVRFGGLQAVDGASIEVPAGRIVGLIGPNGAGKTTFFNALSGHVRPQLGRVELLGQDVSELPPHARARLGMGRTFQLIGLAKDLSVTENLLLAQHAVAGYSLGEALVGLGRTAVVERELRERAEQTVEALGFEQYADTPVRRLSHGQQRIVELGCVLVTAPELVMLDEPSAGMSPGAAENLAVRLRDLRDELGRTVLLIEHNIPLVLDVCDEVYVLSSGQVLAHGVPDEVVARDDVITAYLGEAVAT